MEFRIEHTLSALPRDSTLALFVREDKIALRKARRDLSRQFGMGLTLPLRSGDFQGKEGDVLALYPSRGVFQRVLVVGLGTVSTITLETIRQASAAAARKAESLSSSSLTIALNTLPAIRRDGAAAIAEGVLLGVYKFDRYQTVRKPGDEKRLLRTILFAPARRYHRELARGVEDGRVIAEATVLARDLANAPGNDLYPQSLADAAQEAGNRSGFTVSVLDEKEIEKLGMGGILAVARGSAHPPRLLILEYGPRAQRPVVLVGKGVTFDSGGISIKPSAGMAEMKMDMAGGAAVIGTFQAAAALRLRVHLVGLIPAVENMPSGSSLRPGDILRHHNGMTSEVDNTDAEGRLILADVLSYADRYRPSVIIDLATLTGACVVALGHHAAGMMGNDRKTMTLLQRAGERTHERVWELPLFAEYEKLIKSDVADVKNTGGRWAGAITAALFLKRFIGKNRWVHLDIAGTAMQEEAGPYTQRGGSGFGVRLLVQFLRARG